MKVYTIHVLLGLFGFIALVLIFQHQSKPAVASLDQAATAPAASHSGHNGGGDAASTADLPTRANLHSLQPLTAIHASGLKAPEGTHSLEQLVEILTEAELQMFLNEPVVLGPDKVDLEFRGLLLHRWAEINPSAASAYVEAWPEGSIRTEALGQIASAWGNFNLPEALNWVRGLAEGESKMSAILNLGYEAARIEPRTAIKLALELPPGRTRDELLTHAAGQWAATDPIESAKWAGQITSAALRERILSDLATVWAEDDANLAAGYVATALPAGEFRDRAVTAIVQRWVQRDPMSAAQWVQQFPDTSVRDAAVDNLVSIWATKDPASVGEWLNSLPASPAKDRATAAYAAVPRVSLIDQTGQARSL